MTRRLCAAALVGVVAISAAAAQEKPLVRSRDGRIQAFVEPAGAGCTEAMSVRLDAAPALLAGERETLQRFIGGLRGALTAECPRLDALRIRARSGDRTIYIAHSTKAEGWAALEAPGLETTAAPGRAAALDDAGKRAAARTDARLLGVWSGAPGLTLVDDPARPEHVVWRLGAAEATTILYDLDPARPATLTEQADALGNAAAEACTKEGGQYADPAGRDGAATAIRGLRCRKTNGGWTRYAILARQGAMAHVMQIETQEAQDAGGQEAAALAEAIEGLVLKMW